MRVDRPISVIVIDDENVAKSGDERQHGDFSLRNGIDGGSCVRRNVNARVLRDRAKDGMRHVAEPGLDCARTDRPPKLSSAIGKRRGRTHGGRRQGGQGSACALGLSCVRQRFLATLLGLAFLLHSFPLDKVRDQLFDPANRRRTLRQLLRIRLLVLAYLLQNGLTFSVGTLQLVFFPCFLRQYATLIAQLRLQVVVLLLKCRLLRHDLVEVLGTLIAEATQILKSYRELVQGTR